MDTKEKFLISLEKVTEAQRRINGNVVYTPLMENANYSERLSANVLFKREDLQRVRSYKIRGAYNKICSLSPEQLEKGIVCASAGNHAQGVAYSCNKLKVKGAIFMPAPTPKQKIDQVRRFGKEYVETMIGGDSFDDAAARSMEYCRKNDMVFIHPFDDLTVIEGQGTVALEIIQQAAGRPIDYLLLPIGGGGLASGCASVFKQLSPQTKLIGVEPTGASSMRAAMKENHVVSLDEIETFVDGAAVRRVGDHTFEICKNLLDRVISVDEGKVCSEILRLYNEEAIVVEPAGALSIAALDLLKDEIHGKTVACVVSGGNNDITRMEEIKERAMLYQKLKHYFIVKFPQRAGALKDFVSEILGPNDDITHFEYVKKTNREKGTALVGIELKSPEDFEPLVARMKQKGFFGEYVNENRDLFRFLF